MEYRNFSTITDDEVKFFINDVFKPLNISSIKKYANDDIEVEMNLYQYGISDTVVLNKNEIFSNDFENLRPENKLYEKYLFSLGMDDLLKDNPYLKDDKEIEYDKDDNECSLEW